MVLAMESMILEQRFKYLYIFVDKCEYIHYSHVGDRLQESFAFPLFFPLTSVWMDGQILKYRKKT